MEDRSAKQLRAKAVASDGCGLGSDCCLLAI